MKIIYYTKCVPLKYQMRDVMATPVKAKQAEFMEIQT